MSLGQSTPLVRVVVVAALSCVSALTQGSAGIAQTWSDDSRDRYYAWVEPTTFDRSNAERLFTLYDTGRYAEFDAVANALALSFPNPFEFEADAEHWIGASMERGRRSFVVATVALELASRQLVLHPTRSLPFTNTVHQMNFVLAEVGCAFLRDHPPSRVEHAWHTAFVALARRTRSPFQINAPLPASDRSGAGLAKYDARTLARQLREHDELMKRLRRAATRVSPSTRIDASRLSAQHGLHMQERFPDDPLPAFLDAIDRDSAWAFMFETLLTSRHSPVWLDAAQGEQIARAGARPIRALPSNTRMDRQSAERLLQIVPEVNSEFVSVILRSAPQNAAAESLALWAMVDAFQAVARGEVAAEAYIHLGQNYVRLAQPTLAAAAFVRAEALATTPFETYLSRLFAGAVFEHRGRQTEAIAALRRALQAVPRAQSASMALAPMLLTLDAKEEAADVLKQAMTLPQVDDPLQYYILGDPTAVPRAFAGIRQGRR
jgi:tetratricopeptide (TPR) repeat protein